LPDDPETQVTYLVRTYRQADANALVHASVANSMWPNAPLVVPPDIDNRESGSGKTIRSYYEAAGIKTCLDFANPDGSKYVEPGLFAAQRFKVFSGQCPHFLEEARSYHRDDKGRLVKERDDVISAVRYGFQMIAQHGTPVGERRYATGTGGLYPELGLRRGHAA
jgi:hypothetical protein